MCGLSVSRAALAGAIGVEVWSEFVAGVVVGNVVGVVAQVVADAEPLLEMFGCCCPSCYRRCSAQARSGGLFYREIWSGHIAL